MRSLVERSPFVKKAGDASKQSVLLHSYSYTAPNVMMQTVSAVSSLRRPETSAAAEHEVREFGCKLTETT